MPNLRKAGGAASFVPVVLVQENWVGSGNVSGRTPSPISGGGTWQVDTAGGSTVSFASSVARADQFAYGLFRHSVTLTDATIVANVYPQYAAEGVNPTVTIWARTTPGPSTYPTSGYSVLCNTPESGFTPLTLSKVISGVTTILATSEFDPASKSVSFTVSGSTLTVKVNGVNQLQVTDASITTAGYWGYQVDFTGTGEIDSFSEVGPITIQTA
jgi:hypothetical protein